jgi:hypothetical protein
MANTLLGYSWQAAAASPTTPSAVEGVTVSAAQLAGLVRTTA